MIVSKITRTDTMDCEILEVSDTAVSSTVLLNDEEVSLQSIPLTIDEGKSNGTGSPSHDSLLPDNAVLVQTHNGLLLSMSESIGDITYHSFPPTDLPGRGFLVSCGHDGLVHPPQASDFDTRALDKFPDLSTTLPFSDATASPDKLPESLCFPSDPLPEVDSRVESVTAPGEPSKKKGGWPKGKKRKTDKGKPRTPFTAFVLYMMVRRAEIKRSNPELRFPEVTKILGSEWSAMGLMEKQKYFDQAAADRQRYITELRTLQQSDEYKYCLTRRKLKSLSGVDVNTEPENDDDHNDEDDLHCSVCNQFFSSQHNKTEHMYGSKHFQAVADEIEKGMKEKETLERQLSNHAVNTQTDGEVSEETPNCTDSLDIQSFTTVFYEKNLERELEMQELTKAYKTILHENATLFKKIEQYKEEMVKLERAITNMKTCTLSLASQITSLKMVPMLFGVISL